MKKFLFLFLLIPFISCSKEKYNVFITGENCTYEDIKYAYKGEDFYLKVNVNKGYELIEDEAFIDIQIKNYGAPIGFWHFYSDTQTIFISKEFIFDDISIAIHPDYKVFNLTINFEEGYENNNINKEINLMHPDYKLVILSKDGYKVNENIEITDNVNYSLIKGDSNTQYLFEIKKAEFYQDILVTFKKAVQI